MYCPNCGKQTADNANFCPSCGNKIESVTSIETTDNAAKHTAAKSSAVANDLMASLENIDSIDGLSNYLNSLKAEQDSDSAIAMALQAQLKVIGTIDAHTLTASTYDLIVESLKGAIKNAPNDNIRYELQRSASNMVRCMVFFMDAKIKFLEKKNSEEGKKLLEDACQGLAVATLEITATIGTAGASVMAKEAVKIIAKNLGKKLFQDITKENGIIKRFFDWVTKAKRIEKANSEFNQFLVAVFDKLQRQYDIYGNQSLLGELIENYKNQLVPIAGDKRKALKEIEPDNDALQNKPYKDRTLFLRIFLLTGSILLIVVTVLYFFNWWGGDSWLVILANSSIFVSVFNLHFALLDLPSIVKLLIAAALIGLPIGGFKALSSEKDKMINDHNEYYIELQEKIAEAYYTALSSKYNA